MRRITFAPAGALGIACILLSFGCGGGDKSTGPSGPLAVAIASGDGQNGTVGQAVGTAPSVKVTRSSQPVSGVAVTFAVASGGGTVTGATSTTNASGVAAAGSWVLGHATGTNTLSATVSGASGSPVTFTATAAAGPPAKLEKTAGDNQTAVAHHAVSVRPSVRVTDQFDNPIGSVTVTFAVTAGGGSVTPGSAQTGADGVATLDSWTLGPAQGANTMTASLTGSGITGNPVTFSAQGQVVVLNPSKDTTFTTGTVQVTSMTIAAGRTVTVSGDVTIDADEAVDISGTMQGNCVAIAINSEQAVSVTGTLDNSCAVQPENPPRLKIYAGGGFTIEGATIRRAGALEIENDSTLTDNDFFIAGSSVGLEAHSQNTGAAGTPLVCGSVGHSNFPAPPDAPSGSAGQHGGNGSDGATFTLQCRGADLALAGGADVEGQNGGNGGPGTHNSQTSADASGGNGGKGGLIRVRSTGKVVFVGTGNRIKSGNGGIGGSATATGVSGTVNPAKAANAKATGGDGASPGLVQISGSGGIQVTDPFTIELGSGGQGGVATATGANGTPGVGTTRTQDGGDAESHGGKGGSVPAVSLTAFGNVIGAGNANVTGGVGGMGGAATSAGGNGGDGTDPLKDGGYGGAIKTFGGMGGDALAKGLGTGAPLIAPGGTGGFGAWSNGNGGLGWKECPDLQHGGRGGNGGPASGEDGQGGMGLGGKAADGGYTIITTANGGNGRDGQTHGVKGTKGGQSTTLHGAGTVTSSFNDGVDGKDCAQLSTQTIDAVHVVGDTACPQTLGTFTVTNNGTTPMGISSVVVGSTVIDIVGGTVTIPPGESRTVTVKFNCSQAKSFTGQVRVTATQGPESVDLTVDVHGTVSVKVVTLANDYGPFPAGTQIPLSAFSGVTIAHTHLPNCDSDHIHGPSFFINSGGTFGPFADQNPSGCGIGRISSLVIPAN